MDKILAPIKGRIVEYLVFKGFEKKSFFQNIDVSSSNFRGPSLKSEIGADIVAKISTLYPEINIEWLLTGKGEMLKMANSFEKVQKPDNALNIYEELISMQKKEITRLEKELEEVRSSMKEGASKGDLESAAVSKS